MSAPGSSDFLFVPVQFDPSGTPIFDSSTQPESKTNDRPKDRHACHHFYNDAGDEIFPGYGLELNFKTQRWGGWGDCGAGHCLVSSNFAEWSGEPLAQREIKMMSLMNHLMEKADWATKVTDETITTKWETEALSLPGFSKKMWDFCLAELRDKAEFFKQTGIVLPIDFDAQVAYSDRAVSAEITNELIAAVEPLEDVPEQVKDWHPGSNGQVLDLVHPSLFPLVYGRSKILPKGKVDLENCISLCGEGEVVPVQEEALDENGDDIWSDTFQWLPCEVNIEDGSNPKITSYINNLHPLLHKDLYQVIEKVIAKSIPLWDQVLRNTTDFATYHSRIRVTDHWWSYPYGKKRPQGWNTSDDDPDDDDPIPENLVPVDTQEELEDLDERDDNDAGVERLRRQQNELYDNDYNWMKKTRVLHEPEPRRYPRRKRSRNSDVSSPLDLCKDYKDDGLQVIVKLANIRLTPEKPTYAGGSWHVEGQLNEHIVASSLFYYSQSNIGTSHLSFRQNVNTEQDDLMHAYEQQEFSHLEQIMGIENETDAIQELGTVVTKEGRLLAFPNVLQHRVPPFSLADPSKSGDRKILALFLVDPHTRIISTAKVAPQQYDWWAGEVLNRQSEVQGLKDLPPETMAEVLKLASDTTMSLEEARQYRSELMQERSIKTSKALDGAVQQFSFCEH